MSGKNRIIRHTNKKSGVTYIYWGHSTYIQGQPYPEVSKQCIGKIGTDGSFVPNKTFHSLSKDIQESTELVYVPDQVNAQPSEIAGSVYESKNYGYIALIEQAAEKTGILSSLQSAFPHEWKLVLSVIESMMTHPERNVFRFKHFHDTCWHTYGIRPTDRIVSQVLESVDELLVHRFFSNYRKRVERQEHRLILPGDMAASPLDTSHAAETSSFSEFGGDETSSYPADIIVLGDTVSSRPILYRNLPGLDISSYQNGSKIREYRSSHTQKGPLLVFPPHVFTPERVYALLKGGFRFLTGIPLQEPLIADVRSQAYEKLAESSNYDESRGIFFWKTSVAVPAPRRGRGPNVHTLQLSFFLDPVKRAKEQQRVTKEFLQGKTMLQRDPSLYLSHPYYHRYFIVKEENTKVQIDHDTGKQKERTSQCGISCYLSSPGLTPEQVMRSAESRQLFSDSFSHYTYRLKRPRHPLDEFTEGKRLLVFIETVLKNWILREMRTHYLDRIYTLESLREVLHTVKWNKTPGGAFQEGTWEGASQEGQKLLCLFSLAEESMLDAHIPHLVRKEEKARRIEYER